MGVFMMPVAQLRSVSRCLKIAGVGSLSLVLLWSATANAQTLTAGEPAAAFDVTNFATGLTNPTDIAFLPDGRAVITSKAGNVIIRKPDMTQMTAGRIAVTPLHNEQGLLGVVADPAFTTNKTLYFYASAGTTTAAKNRVVKVTLGDDNVLAVANAVIIVDQDPARMLPGLEGPANHDGGGLVIFKNQLYIGVGDTGHNNQGNVYGNCLNVPTAKILRVNLDGSVPQDNPLVGKTNVSGCPDWNGPIAATYMPDPRIFAWGFRNPWRLWIDAKTSKLWIADVGEGQREEISVGDGKGQHFGWPFYEGVSRFSAGECTSITPSTACVPPVYEYPHTMGNNSITGGLIPEGCGWAAPWTSRYFFSDHGSGRYWTLDVNAARDGVVPNSVKDFATGPSPASMRQGLDHALYVVSHGGGTVARIAPKGLAGMNCAMAPVPGGNGNMGGTGGAGGAGTGGAAGSGGAGGGSGGAAGGAGGAPGTGGAGAGTGGSSATGSGGAGAGTGGSSGTGGMGPGAGAASSGGCGCGLGGGLPAGLALSAPALAALVLAVRRRRARQRR